MPTIEVTPAGTYLLPILAGVVFSWVMAHWVMARWAALLGRPLTRAAREPARPRRPAGMLRAAARRVRSGWPAVPGIRLPWLRVGRARAITVPPGIIPAGTVLDGTMLGGPALGVMVLGGAMAGVTVLGFTVLGVTVLGGLARPVSAPLIPAPPAARPSVPAPPAARPSVPAPPAARPPVPAPPAARPPVPAPPAARPLVPEPSGAASRIPASHSSGQHGHRGHGPDSGGRLTWFPRRLAAGLGAALALSVVLGAMGGAGSAAAATLTAGQAQQHTPQPPDPQHQPQPESAHPAIIPVDRSGFDPRKVPGAHTQVINTKTLPFTDIPVPWSETYEASIPSWLTTPKLTPDYIGRRNRAGRVLGKAADAGMAAAYGLLGNTFLMYSTDVKVERVTLPDGAVFRVTETTKHSDRDDWLYDNTGLPGPTPYDAHNPVHIGPFDFSQVYFKILEVSDSKGQSETTIQVKLLHPNATGGYQYAPSWSIEEPVHVKDGTEVSPAVGADSWRQTKKYVGEWEIIRYQFSWTLPPVLGTGLDLAIAAWNHSHPHLQFPIRDFKDPNFLPLKLSVIVQESVFTTTGMFDDGDLIGALRRYAAGDYHASHRLEVRVRLSIDPANIPLITTNDPRSAEDPIGSSAIQTVYIEKRWQIWNPKTATEVADFLETLINPRTRSRAQLIKDLLHRMMTQPQQVIDQADASARAAMRRAEHTASLADQTEQLIGTADKAYRQASHTARQAGRSAGRHSAGPATTRLTAGANRLLDEANRELDAADARWRAVTRLTEQAYQAGEHAAYLANATAFAADPAGTHTTRDPLVQSQRPAGKEYGQRGLRTARAKAARIEADLKSVTELNEAALALMRESRAAAARASTLIEAASAITRAVLARTSADVVVRKAAAVQRQARALGQLLAEARAAAEAAGQHATSPAAQQASAESRTAVSQADTAVRQAQAEAAPVETAAVSSDRAAATAVQQADRLLTALDQGDETVAEQATTALTEAATQSAASTRTSSEHRGAFSQAHDAGLRQITAAFAAAARAYDEEARARSAALAQQAQAATAAATSAHTGAERAVADADAAAGYVTSPAARAAARIAQRLAGHAVTDAAAGLGHAATATTAVSRAGRHIAAIGGHARTAAQTGDPLAAQGAVRGAAQSFAEFAAAVTGAATPLGRSTSAAASSRRAAAAAASYTAASYAIQAAAEHRAARTALRRATDAARRLRDTARVLQQTAPGTPAALAAARRADTAEQAVRQADQEAARAGAAADAAGRAAQHSDPDAAHSFAGQAAQYRTAAQQYAAIAEAAQAGGAQHHHRDDLPPGADQTTCKCFPAGTMVATPHGSVPIQDIRVGDVVWAYDFSTGKPAARRVTAVFHSQASSLITMTVDGTQVQVTPDHPFWVPGRGWVAAGRLRAGDPLLRRTGQRLWISRLTRRTAHTTIYNFTVTSNHDYYVSPAELLVHNCANGSASGSGRGRGRKKPLSEKLPYVHGPAPVPPQNVIYALFRRSGGEFLKWGQTMDFQSRYGSGPNSGADMNPRSPIYRVPIEAVVIATFDTPSKGGNENLALAVERYLFSTEAGPFNQETGHAGQARVPALTAANADQLRGELSAKVAQLLPLALRQEIDRLGQDTRAYPAHRFRNDTKIRQLRQYLSTLPPRDGSQDTQCNCFPAGTLVSTATGQVPIQDIRVGSRVLARSLSTGLTQARTVTALFHRPASRMLAIGVAGLTVRVTPDHLFWVPGQGWVPAGQLRPGEDLMERDGQPVPINRITRSRVHTTVYNFTVAGDHDYYVSPAQLLVHNCTQPGYSKLIQAAAHLATTTRQLRSALAEQQAARKHGRVRRASQLGRQVARLSRQAAQLEEQFLAAERDVVNAITGAEPGTPTVEHLGHLFASFSQASARWTAAATQLSQFTRQLSGAKPGTARHRRLQMLVNRLSRQLAGLREAYSSAVADIIKALTGETVRMYFQRPPGYLANLARRLAQLAAQLQQAGTAAERQSLLDEYNAVLRDFARAVLNSLQDSSGLAGSHGEQIQLNPALDQQSKLLDQLASLRPLIRTSASDATYAEIGRVAQELTRYLHQPGTRGLLSQYYLQRLHDLLTQIQAERQRPGGARTSRLGQLNRELDAVISTITGPSRRFIPPAQPPSRQPSQPAPGPKHLPAPPPRQVSAPAPNQVPGPQRVPATPVVATSAFPQLPFEVPPRTTTGPAPTLPGISRPPAGPARPSAPPVTAPVTISVPPVTVVPKPVTPPVTRPATTHSVPTTTVPQPSSGVGGAVPALSGLGSGQGTASTLRSALSKLSAQDPVAFDELALQAGVSPATLSSAAVSPAVTSEVAQVLDTSQTAGTADGALTPQMQQVIDGRMTPELKDELNKFLGQSTTAASDASAGTPVLAGVGNASNQAGADGYANGPANFQQNGPSFSGNSSDAGSPNTGSITMPPQGMQIQGDSVPNPSGNGISPAGGNSGLANGRIPVDNSPPLNNSAPVDSNVPVDSGMPVQVGPVTVNPAAGGAGTGSSLPQETSSSPYYRPTGGSGLTELPNSSVADTIASSQAAGGAVSLAAGAISDGINGSIIQSWNPTTLLMNLVQAHDIALKIANNDANLASPNGYQYVNNDPTRADEWLRIKPLLYNIEATIAQSGSHSAELQLLYDQLIGNPQAQSIADTNCGNDSSCLAQQKTGWAQLTSSALTAELIQENAAYGPDPQALAKPIYDSSGNLVTVINKLTGQTDPYLALVYQFRSTSNTGLSIPTQTQWQQYGVPPSVISQAASGNATAITQANEIAAQNQAATNADIAGYSQLISGFTFTPAQQSSPTQIKQQYLDSLGSYLTSAVNDNQQYRSLAVSVGANPFSGNGAITYSGGQFTSTNLSNTAAVQAANQLNLTAAEGSSYAALAAQVSQNSTQLKEAAAHDLQSQGVNIWFDPSTGNVYTGNSQDQATVSQQYQAALNNEAQKQYNSLVKTYQTNLSNSYSWATTNLPTLPDETGQDYSNRVLQQSDQIATCESLGTCTPQQAQAMVQAEDHTAAKMMGLPGNSATDITPGTGANDAAAKTQLAALNLTLEQQAGQLPDAPATGISHSIAGLAGNYSPPSGGGNGGNGGQDPGGNAGQNLNATDPLDPKGNSGNTNTTPATGNNGGLQRLPDNQSPPATTTVPASGPTSGPVTGNNGGPQRLPDNQSPPPTTTGTNGGTAGYGPACHGGGCNAILGHYSNNPGGTTTGPATGNNGGPQRLPANNSGSSSTSTTANNNQSPATGQSHSIAGQASNQSGSTPTAPPNSISGQASNQSGTTTTTSSNNSSTTAPPNSISGQASNQSGTTSTS